MNKLKKLGLLFNYFIKLLTDSLSLNNKINQNIVYVNIKYPLKFRFFYRLIYVLSRLGYQVRIYLPTPRSFVMLAKMGGHLNLLPPTRLTIQLPKKYQIFTYCTDHKDNIWDSDWEKRIFIELNLENRLDSEENPIFIPFSVHDYIHRCFWQDRENMLGNNRNIRLLFAGAYRDYQGRGVSEFLGKLERQEIIDLYRNHPNTIAITSQKQLDEVLKQTPSKKFYFIDGHHFRIPGEQWLEVLSHVDVFLCPPGVVNPMSYNANEAIAMGAIPLINYPEWFHPQLKNRENSLVFSTLNDLEKCLDHLATCSTEELLIIRRNVLNYFNLYQSDLYLEKKMNEYIDQRNVTFLMNVEQENLKNISDKSIAIAQ